MSSESHVGVSSVYMKIYSDGEKDRERLKAAGEGGTQDEMVG